MQQIVPLLCFLVYTLCIRLRDTERIILCLLFSPDLTRKHESPEGLKLLEAMYSGLL